ncbi:MAG: TonB-dependent receptor [Betaproteobacteria bacterium]
MPSARTRLAAAVGAAVFGGQDATAQDYRITVTGTNIKRADTETAAPIETITREDILASELQTISDVVRQITANNNGSVSPSFTNGFSASGSAVSLRGLGPNNTLVLLNGRRLANFGLADDAHAPYVDLQQIPFDAVERIEVLKDGASAIYGSDAVAGVVNVILRQQYTGLTATATTGTTTNGQGSQFKGAVNMGMGDLTKDRYNVFATIDGQKQDAIPTSKGRAYMGTNELRGMGLPDLRPGRPPNAASNLLGNVIAVSATNPNGPSIGAYQLLPGACAPPDQDGPYCRWDVKGFTDLQPSVDRVNVLARGTLRVTDDVEAHAEASYFHVATVTRASPPFVSDVWPDPASTSVVSSFKFHLDVGHPDNPFGLNNQVARLRYADAALGGRTTSFDTGTQRYLVGLKGTTRGWDWDVAALYIRSDTDSEWSHLYSYDSLLAGLAGRSPYGYYRVGLNASLNDPAVYEWIAPQRAYGTFSANTVVDAKASRDLYGLDGGQIALAVGYEYRKEELRNPGIPGTETGNVVGMGYTTVSGSRIVNGLFAELYAPLLRNLELTAAVRFDDYSDFDSTTNPKVGIKWNALPALALRGTWQTAFRAPGLYEAGYSNATYRTSVNDPIRDERALNVAAITSNLSPGPETTTSYTAGVVWEPLPGVSATLDYWRFRTDGQIAAPEWQAIVDNPVAFPGLPVVRDTNDLPGIPNSGTILVVGSRYLNAGVFQTDGVDLDVVWQQRLGEWGSLRMELAWTHIFNYSQSFGNGTTYDYADTQGPVSVGSAAGTPQDRASLVIGWTRGPFTVTGTVRYVNDYEAIQYQGFAPVVGRTCVGPFDTPGCHVASFTMLGLSAQCGGFRNWQVFGSIINVFNRMAPFAPGAGRRGRGRQLRLQLGVLRRDRHPVQPGRSLHFPIAGGFATERAGEHLRRRGRHSRLSRAPDCAAGSGRKRCRSASRTRIASGSCSRGPRHRARASERRTWSRFHPIRRNPKLVRRRHSTLASLAATCQFGT